MNVAGETDVPMGPEIRSPLETSLGYMKAVDELETALGQAIALTSALERNEIPDDLALIQMRAGWDATLTESRKLCRQPRRRPSERS